MTSRCGEIAGANASVVRALMERVLHEGQLQLLPELIAPDYVGHLPIGDHYGPEGVRIEFAAYREAIHDLTVTVDYLFASEDRVVRHFTLRGVDPDQDGAVPIVLRGHAIDRLEGGRLVESWVHVDALPATKPW